MWLARDMDGTLWLYEKRPHRADIVWDCDSYYDSHMKIDDPRFDHVKWEDDSATEVVLVTKKYLMDLKDHVDSEG